MKLINEDGDQVAELPDNLGQMLLKRGWTQIDIDIQPPATKSAPTDGVIKGNQSGIYHTPDSPNYKRCKAEFFFDTEEEAQAAGFRRWGKQTDDDA
jgi:hypothetical protein